MHRLANGNCPASQFRISDTFTYLGVYLSNENSLQVKQVDLNLRKSRDDSKANDRSFVNASEDIFKKLESMSL